MKRFSNILLVLDSDTDNTAALNRATTLAKDNQAELTVCAVVDATTSESQMASTGITPAELRDIAVSECRDRLEEMVKNTVDAGISAETRVFIGKPFIEIIRQVLRHNHDLVIKCTEGAPRLSNMLFGSRDMHLLRKCPCPVWITKSTESTRYRRILAAVDRDPEDAVKDVLNRQILEMSMSLALAECSELHIAHAWQFAGEDILRSARTGLSDAEVDAMETEEVNERRRWLKHFVTTFSTKAVNSKGDCVSPHFHVMKGDAKHAVPATAQELDVDLVVMGTVARTGIAGFFMGNTAETILNQLDCSVLTIKPPGFVSPVALEA
jgi:nucleotide-binding universal stress UspA family protein